MKGQPPRSFNLATGVSETLKVNPARRLLNIMMTGKHGGAKKVGNVINLHFEGNWMPIQVMLILSSQLWSATLRGCSCLLAKSAAPNRAAHVSLLVRCIA